jgi:hypothetical protein
VLGRRRLCSAVVACARPSLHTDWSVCTARSGPCQGSRPPVRRADRFRVVVHVDADALRRSHQGQSSHSVMDGQRVSAETSRRLVRSPCGSPHGRIAGRPSSRFGAPAARHYFRSRARRQWRADSRPAGPLVRFGAPETLNRPDRRRAGGRAGGPAANASRSRIAVSSHRAVQLRQETRSPTGCGRAGVQQAQVRIVVRHIGRSSHGHVWAEHMVAVPTPLTDPAPRHATRPCGRRSRTQAAAKSSAFLRVQLNRSLRLENPPLSFRYATHGACRGR